MALIGYARVSTEDQATFSQLDDLKAAGYAVIFEEKASGANRARPELARAVARVGRGDILVVTHIDRLAHSLSHLLEVIERVEAVGGHFKSLRDPIDTTTPQGKFALQVLGAAAELERALAIFAHPLEKVKSAIVKAHCAKTRRLRGVAAL